MPDDQHIAHLLHRDEKEGFDALFRTYYPIVVKTAYYLTTDQEVAEDLAQELFMRIWNKREKLQVVQKLKGYLLTSIRNSALDYLEKQKNDHIQLETIKLEWKANLAPTNPDQSPEELKHRIELLVSKLPNQCRLVFSLNRFEGLSNDEISEYLGISKRTVETHISKALKIMREEIKNGVE